MQPIIITSAIFTLLPLITYGLIMYKKFILIAKPSIMSIMFSILSSKIELINPMADKGSRGCIMDRVMMDY